MKNSIFGAVASFKICLLPIANGPLGNKTEVKKSLKMFDLQMSDLDYLQGRAIWLQSGQKSEQVHFMNVGPPPPNKFVTL